MLPSRETEIKLKQQYITNSYKQLLDEVAVLEIVKGKISVISKDRMLRLITLDKTLIIFQISQNQNLLTTHMKNFDMYHA